MSPARVTEESLRHMTLTAPSPRRAASALAVALASLAAAGCGSSASSAGDDPAGLVPSRAPVYVEATVAPDGTLRSDALAAAGKILGTNDPEARIAELLQGAKGSGADDVDFTKDVQPWLGREVGVFFLTSAKNGDGAVVAATSDPDKASAFVAGRGSKTEKYKDVTIHLKGEDATALVQDTVVAGSLAGVRASIDASQDGGLADQDAFKDAMKAAGTDDALGRAYIAPRALLTAAGKTTTGASVAPFDKQLSAVLPTAIALRATADGQAVRVDAATIGGRKSETKADPALVASLPADAWFAAGIGEVGTTVQTQLDQVGNIGGMDASSLLAIVKSQTGLDVKQDLLRWMGQGAIYVRGTSSSQLGGALVVTSTDPAASKAAIAKIEALLPTVTQGAATATPLSQSGVDAGFELKGQGLPVPVAIAAAGDKFIIAVGDGVLGDAISPSATLGASADFTSAAALLGDGLKPVLYLGAKPVADLVGSLGSTRGTAADQAKVKQVQDTLGRFTALVAATRGDSKSRAVVGLR
jgi:hypothetical protein